MKNTAYSTAAKLGLKSTLLKFEFKQKYSHIARRKGKTIYLYDKIG